MYYLSIFLITTVKPMKEGIVCNEERRREERGRMRKMEKKKKRQREKFVNIKQ